MPELDEVDYGILHLLQEDARNTTPVDIAEELPVSAQTVRNRISNLEEQGIIERYIPVINYDKADFPLRLEFTCTAPVEDREELAREALELHHVVQVREMLSAKENLRALAVTRDAEEIHQLARELVDLGLEIDSERLMRQEYSRPMNHFGDEILENR